MQYQFVSFFSKKMKRTTHIVDSAFICLVFVRFKAELSCLFHFLILKSV